MAHITNADIVPAALRGESKDAGNFWTTGEMLYFGSFGYLPSRLRTILHERRAFITQIIYSYSTPIAWLDDGKWIVPDVTYSATTSSKHQSQLWQLRAEKIPYDAGMDEYMQVLAGKTHYVPNYRNRLVGSYVAA